MEVNSNGNRILRFKWVEKAFQKIVLCGILSIGLSFADERSDFVNSIDLKLSQAHIKLTRDFEKLVIKKYCIEKYDDIFKQPLEFNKYHEKINECEKKERISSIMNRFNEYVLKLSNDLLLKSNDFVFNNEPEVHFQNTRNQTVQWLDKVISDRFVADRIFEQLEKRSLLSSRTKVRS